MVSVAYPVAYAALLDLADDQLNLRVVDGWDPSNANDDVLMLGVPNLADSVAISSGSFAQEQVGHGAAGYIKETGSINGLMVAWNGDATDDGALSARSTAFGYLDALNAAVRNNRSLSVTAFDLNVGAAFANGDVSEDKVNGATCVVSFAINYTALLGA